MLTGKGQSSELINENKKAATSVAVSTGNNIREIKMQPTTLANVFGVIKNNDSVKKQITELRAETDEKKQIELKKQLAYFNIGEFKSNTRKKENLS